MTCENLERIDSSTQENEFAIELLFQLTPLMEKKWK